jgi:PAS domain S-box-containing protein
MPENPSVSLNNSEPQPAPRDLSDLWWEPLVQVSLDGQFVLRPVDDDLSDFELLYANEPGAKLANSTAQAIVGKLLSEVAPPYGSGFREALTHAHRTGEAVHRTTKRIAPNVNARRAEFRVQPFSGLLALSVIDRTDEYEAEAAAETLRGQLSIATENSPTAFAVFRPVRDTAGNFVDLVIEEANDASATLLQKPLPEILGRGLFVTLQNVPRALAKLAHRCLTEHQILSVDWDFRTYPVQADWLRIQLTPFGEFVVFHAQDISGERHEQELLRGIVDNVGELVIFTDTFGTIQHVNPFGLRMLGYSESDLLATSILSLTHPDDRSVIMEESLYLADRLVDRRRRRVRVVDKLGKVRTILGSPMGVWGVGGELTGVVTIATDISELLASEEARGQLAGELAMAEQTERERVASELHDGPVQDLTALSMRVGAALSVKENADLLAAEGILTKTIADLRLLMFQLSPPSLDGDGLGQAIHQRAEHLFSETGVKVRVLCNLSPPPPAAQAVTLFRIAQEALVNAFKHAYAESVTVRLFDSPEGEMVLAVTDDGSGAELDQYQRHSPGHLGLAMMHERARHFGGSCVIAGAPGEGTTVTARFPRSETI